MKVIPIAIEIERWGKYSTFLINIIEFDWCDGGTSLLEIGFYQGDFRFDILFYEGIYRFIQNKLIR